MSDKGASAAAPAGRSDRLLRGMLRRRPERYGFLLYLLIVDIIISLTVPTGSWWAFFGTPFVAPTLLLGLYTTRVRRRALIVAWVFIGVNGVSSQPFLAQGANDQPETYVYLSFITLATVGYGDYTPAGSLPRALCSLEAIMGQIFLVTTVARLVSLYGPGKRRVANNDEGGGSS